MQTFNRIDELARQLQSLLPMKPEDQARLDKKIRLEFNYNSNHIEGNTLTYGETELLLIFDKTTGNHELREYEEMKSHDVAFEIIKEWAADKDRPLTEAAIKELHKTLLVRPFWKEAITPDGQPTRRKIKVGAYKEYSNSVRLQNGEIFHYASPQETPIKMGELIQWYRDEEEKGELHPVALAALLHYKFVVIHPFDDGNGRLSRLLMNYVLLRHDLPPVIIQSADKKNYLFALNQADTGDIDSFINYIIDQIDTSLRLYLKAAKSEDLEEDDDIKKEISVLSKKLKAKTHQTKHPAIVYKTYSWFSTEVWSEIKQALTSFDALFSEKKEFRYINMQSEIFPKRNIMEPPFLKSIEPKKVEIFGKDIYEDDINELKWELKLYGLIGAKSKAEMNVSGVLDLRVDKFYMTLYLDYKIIESIECSYGNEIPKGDIDKIIKKIVSTMLQEIKDKTANNNF